MIDARRECLVRVKNGYVRELGSPEHEPDDVFICSRKVPPPQPCRVTLYNGGFTAVAEWRQGGRDRTCLVSVVPYYLLRKEA